MGDYGEPWQLKIMRDDEGDRCCCIVDAHGNVLASEACPFDEREYERIIACVNALASVPRPDGVPALVDLARRIVLDASTHDTTEWGDDAIAVLRGCGVEV